MGSWSRSIGPAFKGCALRTKVRARLWRMRGEWRERSGKGAIILNNGDRALFRSGSPPGDLKTRGGREEAGGLRVLSD
jgi:hypothetical protein